MRNLNFILSDLVGNELERLRWGGQTSHGDILIFVLPAATFVSDVGREAGKIRSNLNKVQ